MYSLITATKRYEFDDYVDLCDFFSEIRELHFIVEFSKDSNKGYNRLYFPQDMYGKSECEPSEDTDICIIESALVEMYNVSVKRLEL